jgi:hypothetical protein
MKRIDRFEAFLESQQAKMVSECALVLLPELESALVSAYKRGSADSSAIGISNLAEDLLAKRGKETGKDIAFADLDGDKIAFSTERAIWKEFPAEAGIGFSRGVADRQTALQAEKMAGRQKMNIGRWIRAIAGEGHADADVERLAGFLKAHGSRKLGYEKGISEGEDIKRFYAEAAAECRPGSSLYNSCMKDKHKIAPNVFDIYEKNPETVKIAYLQNAEGKISSRALLWKAEGLAPGMPKEFWFMDRIYSADEWMTQEMQKWADQEGWARRKSNIGGRIVIKGQEFRPEMRAKVRKIAYRGFPYMDTFVFYATKLGYLYSFSVEEEGLGLQSTHGDYGTATGFMPRARNYIRRFAS